jgi:hypothetical protein
MCDDDVPVDLELVEAPYVEASIERRLAGFASTLWCELRERAGSLDSERWTAVVLARLNDVVVEFNRRLARLDSMYLSKRAECDSLESRVRKYQRKYGCIECGGKVVGVSSTDKCSSCCHLCLVQERDDDDE